MKVINSKNKNEFIEWIEKIIEEYEFIDEENIQGWLEENGKDYFINIETYEWEENED